MHALQKGLLEVVNTHDLGRMSLRKIGELLGEKHPQKIKHHLLQLEQKGLIEVDRGLRTVRQARTEDIPDDRLARIPILGGVNCGPATLIAQEDIQGFLQISYKLISRTAGLFALRAQGSSMNRATIDGFNIEDGDYVIVDSERHTPRNRDYVVCVTGGLANIKRFIKDETNKHILLASESTEDFPPIVLHPDDVEFFVSGIVIKVVKKPTVV